MRCTPCSDESPADRWARASDGVRMPDANVGEHFLAEQKRRVQEDRTITLEGVAFEVDAALVGERVLLRYDAGKARDKRVVEVWYEGLRVEIARRVDVLANCFVKRHAPRAPSSFRRSLRTTRYLRACPCASWSTLRTASTMRACSDVRFTLA